MSKKKKNSNQNISAEPVDAGELTNAEVEVSEAQAEIVADNKTPKEDNKAKKEDKKKAKKEKKQNKVAKKTKETFSELKKVSWPSFGQVVKKTGVVLAVVVIFTVVLFGIDYLLGLLFNLFTSAVK